MNDATLAALSLSSGVLSPAFDPATTGYTASVANGVGSVVVSATPENPAATFTVNGDTDTSVDLVVGENVIEVTVTAEDGVATEAYTVTVTRAAPPPTGGGGGGGGSAVLTITPTLEVVNDDGGSATVDDFTVLLNGEAIEFDEATTGPSGLNHLTMGGPVSLYAFTFSGDCDANGFFSLSLGDEFDCAIEADDLPLAQVLSVPLPDAETLIDESLSFAFDSFLLESVPVVQASTAEPTPLLTVTVPLAAVLGQSSLTVSVIEGNADAAHFNPVGGTVFIGRTAYDIQILDASGNPIATFPTPIELSFLLPDGVDGDTVAAYFWDEDTGAWIGETGQVIDGRFVVTTSHLTTFALFAFGDLGGGFRTALPASGIALTVSEGGTITQLRRALAAAGAEAVFVTRNGRFVGYFPDAPDFVNAEFFELFGGSVPAGQPMMVSLGG